MSLIALDVEEDLDELPLIDINLNELAIIHKNGKLWKLPLGTLASLTGTVIGQTYFQGPHDASPSTLWPGTTWSDVSYEEENLTRRVVGSLAGAFFGGTPARLSVSVAGGVPTISVVSGGSGYLGGGNGSLPLVIAGACTTQMVATATVTLGVVTGITVGTAGVGYTSGAVAVYDGVVGRGDLVQKYKWQMWGTGHTSPRSGLGFGTADCVIWESGYTLTLVADGNGSARVGAETSGAWIAVKKWRRTA
jgi:hypothetical protein